MAKKKANMPPQPEELYVHSKCCMAHWELVYWPLSHTYTLVCEKCGTAAGVTVTGPHFGCECEVCKKGG